VFSDRTQQYLDWLLDKVFDVFFSWLVQKVLDRAVSAFRRVRISETSRLFGSMAFMVAGILSLEVGRFQLFSTGFQVHVPGTATWGASRALSQLWGLPYTVLALCLVGSFLLMHVGRNRQ